MGRHFGRQPMFYEQAVLRIEGMDAVAPGFGLGVADPDPGSVLPAPAVPFGIDAETDDAAMPPVARQHQVDQRADVGIGRLDLQPDLETVPVELIEIGFVGVLGGKNDAV